MEPVQVTLPIVRITIEFFTKDKLKSAYQDVCVLQPGNDIEREIMALCLRSCNGFLREMENK